MVETIYKENKSTALRLKDSWNVHRDPILQTNINVNNTAAYIIIK